MEAIVPYLTFNGNAREAMEFYAAALNGKIVMLQTFGEAPIERQENADDRIMHAVLEAGPLKMMASDTQPGMEITTGNNLSLSLNFTDAESIKKTFEHLKQDGVVTMELQETFWGATFGMCVDKYGNSWMFNYDHPQQ